MKPKRHTLLSARHAVLALTIVSAVAAASAVAEIPVSVREKFRMLDADHDGYLVRSEVKRFRGYARAFDEADENRDGRLDSAEFIKAESFYQRLEAAEYIDDTVITAKVKAGLLKDPQLDSLGVSVATRRGRVLLTGLVDDPKQRVRALRLASSIAGVVSVTNNLALKSQPSVPLVAVRDPGKGGRN